MQTKNAVCQRIGHRDSGRVHASGLPICLTCNKPFDDDDGLPSMIVSSFNDPDDAAILTRRIAEPPKPPAPAAAPQIIFRNLEPWQVPLAKNLTNLFTQATNQPTEFFVFINDE